MYTQEDMRLADARVRRYGWLLGCALALLLAAYVAAIAAGSQPLMLLIALTAFWFSALEICLWLRPAVQYRAFLRDMNRGLRREYTCLIDSVDEKIQLQDGVHVHALQAILDNGDSRIFYLNISKEAPVRNRMIRLTAYGRHLVQWEELR